jgi:hypothetical protein
MVRLLGTNLIAIPSPARREARPMTPGSPGPSWPPGTRFSGHVAVLPISLSVTL